MDFCDGMVFSNFQGLALPPALFGDVKLYQIGENIMERGGEVFEHTQVCNEISYVISGEADFYSDGEVHHLTKGSIHVIPKGAKHKIVIENSSRFRYFYLGFDLITHEEPTNTDRLSYFYESGAKHATDDGTLLSYFSHFIGELGINDSFNYDMFYSYIKLILIHVYRLFSGDKDCRVTGNTISDDMCGTVFNIIKYIDTNIRTITRVSDIANKMSYSSSYISRIFKQKMGITIQEYISRKKIEKAMELLKGQRLSINEVTEHLNYDSYGSFFTAFKKYAGCSPSDYIKSNKNN